MKQLLAMGLLLATALAAPPDWGGREVGTSSSATASVTSHPAFEARIRRLVGQLGSRSYQEREQAQAELAQLGETAMPILANYIRSPDPEIANRVSSLIVRPSDAELRVDVAIKLLQTGDPALMEEGVYFLFEDPLTDYDLFVKRTANARGYDRAIFEPVREELEKWYKITLRFALRQLRLRLGNIEAANRELEMHIGSKYYQAEAAYTLAVAAMEEYYVTTEEPSDPTTQPG